MRASPTRSLSLRDRLGLLFTPESTARRLARERRNYDAAKPGRRTAGWNRTRSDANALVRTAGGELRMHARDLQRNNAWARRAVDVIVNNVVGWGAQPNPTHAVAEVNKAASALWAQWTEADCDADGRVGFAGLLQVILRAVAVDGEVLVRRRWRRPTDGYAVPMQLQVLEIDHLDTNKTGDGRSGPIIQGVEFDGRGRRVAYWLFDTHPGATDGGRGTTGAESRRVLANEVLHSGKADRPGQARFVSWFASIIASLKDLDSFEDGELQRQAVAASFAAFVTDPQGTADPLTGASNEIQFANGDVAENIEPGAILNLPVGKEVSFPAPPAVAQDSFAERNLRRIAAGIGITYEDLTGDYSNVNFSSSRMARIVHAGNVRTWQMMLEAQVLSPVWQWFVEAATWVGLLPPDDVPAAWTHPPLAMIDPDKEIGAAVKAVRSGISSPDDMVREQGSNPTTHWSAVADAWKRLDALGITIDGDPRKISAAGQAQQVPTTTSQSTEPVDGGSQQPVGN